MSKNSGFEWDKKKEKTNIQEKGVNFSQASEIFTRYTVNKQDSRQNYGEKRYNSLGVAKINGENKVLNVTHTTRGNNKRIISARIANRKELKEYHKRHLESSKDRLHGRYAQRDQSRNLQKAQENPAKTKDDRTRALFSRQKSGSRNVPKQEKQIPQSKAQTPKENTQSKGKSQTTKDARARQHYNRSGSPQSRPSRTNTPSRGGKGGGGR